MATRDSVPHRTIAWIARLLSLPVTEPEYLLPLTPGRIRIQEPKAPEAAAAGCARPSLTRLWLDLVQRERPAGLSAELAEKTCERFWGRQETVDLARFYNDLAGRFLHPVRGHLALDPDPHRLHIDLSPLDALQLWHWLRLRVGPDLLPALYTSGLARPTRQALIRRGLAVDDAHVRPLAQLLDRGDPPGQGMVDCHVHAGSAFRASLVWPAFVAEVERQPRGLAARFAHDSEDRELRDLIPLFYMAAVVRRVLMLCAVASRADAEWGLKLVRGLVAQYRTKPDLKFLDGSELAEWRHVGGQLAYLWGSLARRPISEAELLIESLAAAGDGPLVGHRGGIHALWWFYARIRARFHSYFIHHAGLEGLGFFRKVYDRSKFLSGFRRLIHRDPRELSRHLNPLGRIRHIELRTPPEPRYLEEYLPIIEQSNRYHRVDRSFPSLSLIVHFVKWGRIEPPHHPLWREVIRLRADLTDLENHLLMNQHRGWPSHLAGLDVAGPELNRPNWFYLPVFVEMRRWWRRLYGPARSDCGHPDLGYTYHAGEEFLHLVQGLRHIWEIVALFPWQPGDRIGHGLALALDAADWQARHPVIIAPIDWLLFDLIWEWGLYAHHGVPCEHGFLHSLEVKIHELGTQLLGDHGARLKVGEWHQLYLALFCPQTLPLLLGLRVVWADGIDHRPRQCRLALQNGKIRAALCRYLKAFGASMPREPYPFRGDQHSRELEIRRIGHLQQWLVRTMARGHIAVEACPTSNLVLAGIPSLLNHPLLRLRDQLTVLVNTDNPLTFGTDMPLEMRLVYESEIARCGNARDALDMVRDILRSGQTFRFGDPGDNG